MKIAVLNSFLKGDGPKPWYKTYAGAFLNFIIVIFDIRVPFFSHKSPDTLGHKFEDFYAYLTVLGIPEWPPVA